MALAQGHGPAATEEVARADAVRLEISEPQTSEDYVTVPIPISAHAVFSKYVLVPRGINFGPMVYDTQKERTFDNDVLARARREGQARGHNPSTFTKAWCDAAMLRRGMRTKKEERVAPQPPATQTDLFGAKL